MPATGSFKPHTVGMEGPVSHAFAVAPSDTSDLAQVRGPWPAGADRRTGAQVLALYQRAVP